MEQFDSSVEESSKVLEQQQRNDVQQCPSCAAELTEASVWMIAASETDSMRYLEIFTSCLYCFIAFHFTMSMYMLRTFHPMFHCICICMYVMSGLRLSDLNKETTYLLNSCLANFDEFDDPFVVHGLTPCDSLRYNLPHSRTISFKQGLRT